jgi:hypothetical protein
VTAAFLVFWTLHPTCLPFETGAAAAASDTPPPMPVVSQPAIPIVPVKPAPPITPPPLTMNERARYRIAYGAFDVGEISLVLDADARAGRGPGPAPLLRARGQGEGSILGIGRLATQVETEFDPGRLASRRWTSTRIRDGATIRDRIDQSEDGKLAMARARDGQPGWSANVAVPAPVLDPVGLLLRLRASPPAVGAPPQVLNLIDGQALWRVTVSATGFDMLDGERATLRLDGRAEPILADGRLDAGGDRTTRSFRLWLSDEPARVPLRLQMPLGLGDLVVSLVDVKRQVPGKPPRGPWWRARLAPTL